NALRRRRALWLLVWSPLLLPESAAANPFRVDKGCRRHRVIAELVTNGRNRGPGGGPPARGRIVLALVDIGREQVEMLGRRLYRVAWTASQEPHTFTVDACCEQVGG